MSVAILTASWKRPDVFRLFLAHVTKHVPASDVYCAGSHDDLCDGIAKEFGIAYERVPNEMGAKWNHAATMSKYSTATHRLFLGSDDFLDARLWAFAHAYDGQHFGLRDCLIHQMETGRTLHWRGYIGPRAGEPVGAGKIIGAEVLDALGWEPFQAGRTHTLDHDMHRKMAAQGFTIDVRPMREVGLLVDVKTANNLTSWHRLRSDRPSRALPPNWLRETSPALYNDIQP